MGAVVRSDATAAIGMVARVGLGRVRHLAVSDLWVQGKARSKAIRYEKVEGRLNPSDILTKGVEADLLKRHLETVGIIALPGRPEIAPKAKVLDGQARPAEDGRGTHWLGC